MSQPAQMTYAAALNRALAEAMREDPKVVVLGEDIGPLGGIFTVTQGLLDEFGTERVFETPLSEACYVGCGTGLALCGWRPVVELMFSDFLMVAMDQVCNQAAKLRYMTGGQARLPMTLRAPIGARNSAAAQHSQSPQAWFAHTPGLRVVMPATPADALGLLASAIECDDPVLVLEHKFHYQDKGPVPDGRHRVPLGKADIKRSGKDVSIVACSRMTLLALEAAEELAAEGVEAEVVDLRSLNPLDRETIVGSAARTRRAVVVDEGVLDFGITGELAALLHEELFDELLAPVVRVGAVHAPIPFSPPLETAAVPQVADIRAAVRRCLGKERADTGAGQGGG